MTGIPVRHLPPTPENLPRDYWQVLEDLRLCAFTLIKTMDPTCTKLRGSHPLLKFERQIQQQMAEPTAKLKDVYEACTPVRAVPAPGGFVVVPPGTRRAREELAIALSTYQFDFTRRAGLLGQIDAYQGEENAVYRYTGPSFGPAYGGLAEALLNYNERVSYYRTSILLNTFAEAQKPHPSAAALLRRDHPVPTESWQALENIRLCAHILKRRLDPYYNRLDAHDPGQNLERRLMMDVRPYTDILDATARTTRPVHKTRLPGYQVGIPGDAVEQRQKLAKALDTQVAIMTAGASQLDLMTSRDDLTYVGPTLGPAYSSALTAVLHNDAVSAKYQALAAISRAAEKPAPRANPVLSPHVPRSEP